MAEFRLSDFPAILFDMDGVITPTAEVHMRAWDRMFTEFLTERGISEPYTDHDYFEYVDGKPRYEGVDSFLKSRGIDLPWGEKTDDPSAETVCGLGNRKNDLVLTLLREEGVQPYPGTVALLDSLSDDVRIAVVSSSRNAEEVLSAAGLLDRFGVIVDGNVAEREGLPGKPAPDTFVHAAQQLGADPATTLVVEDAVSGVRAGAAGPFAAVLGVNRGVGAEKLYAAGATLVVDDLGVLA